MIEITCMIYCIRVGICIVLSLVSTVDEFATKRLCTASLLTAHCHCICHPAQWNANESMSSPYWSPAVYTVISSTPPSVAHCHSGSFRIFHCLALCVAIESFSSTTLRSQCIHSRSHPDAHPFVLFCLRLSFSSVQLCRVLPQETVRGMHRPSASSWMMAMLWAAVNSMLRTWACMGSVLAASASLLKTPKRLSK